MGYSVNPKEFIQNDWTLFLQTGSTKARFESLGNIVFYINKKILKKIFTDMAPSENFH